VACCATWVAEAPSTAATATFVPPTSTPRTTQVEVSFAEEDGATRVTLEHRGFEVHGETGAAMRESVGGDGGWPWLMELYRRVA
jgi:hypothetical protein